LDATNIYYFLEKNGEEMYPALIVVLSALATGFLVALVLFVERWEWEHGIEFHLKGPGWGGSIWDRVLFIINREGETVTYRVEVRTDGVISNETGPVMLEHDGK